MFAICNAWVETLLMTSHRATGIAAGADVSGADVSPADADAVLAACRVLVALSAQSIAAVDDLVDVTQVRVLVIVASTEPVSLGVLAEAAQLHPSTASRLCDRMVGEDLLDRTDDPTNRRALSLRLTANGRRVVAAMVRHRRQAIMPMLRAMPAPRRKELVEALRAFADAGGEPPDRELWSMGWTTE
jgi:DNA-binding MarR family transcriptional regulator